MTTNRAQQFATEKGSVMYRYTATEAPIEHADHTWEEWHAYVCDITDAPEFVNGNSTGICCHTCSTIVLDATPATDDLF